MVLCAYAKMDHPPGPLLTGVAAQLLHDGRVASMAGQELSMLLWACAKLGERLGPLLDLIASELNSRLQQDLRSFASGEGALASSNSAEKAGENGVLAAEALLYGARRSWVTKPSLAEQHAEAGRILSNVTWAYAKLNYHPGGLLHSTATCCAPLLPTMPTKDVSRLVWGFAKLGYGSRSFLDSTLGELTRSDRLPNFRPIQVRI